MTISTIKGLYRCVKQNTNFSGHTVKSVFLALGYNLCGSTEDFKELSNVLIDCYNNGAESGFAGFTYQAETLPFYRKHRLDIVSQMENAATTYDIDIIAFIQGFGMFLNTTPPPPGQIGKALWDSRYWPELEDLYNLFAWYVLEEVSNAWNGYLEDHPTLAEKLSA